jgi:hypothetical protein
MGEKMARFTVYAHGTVRVALSLAGQTWRQTWVSVAAARRQWAALVAEGWVVW